MGPHEAPKICYVTIGDGPRKEVKMSESAYDLMDSLLFGEAIMKNKSKNKVVDGITFQDGYVPYEEYGNFRACRSKVTPVNVVWNGPATIVFFSDGSKVIVKCCKYDVYDYEKGFMIAVLTRYLGRKGFRSLMKTVNATYKVYFEKTKTPIERMMESMDLLRNALNNNMGGKKK